MRPQSCFYIFVLLAGHALAEPVATDRGQEASTEAVGQEVVPAAGASTLELKGHSRGDSANPIRLAFAGEPMGCFANRCGTSLDASALGWNHSLPEDLRTFGGNAAGFSFVFENDLIDKIMIRIAAVAAPDVVEALAQKYGEPTTSRTIPLVNGYGVESEEYLFSWVLGGDELAVTWRTRSDGEALIALLRYVSPEEKTAAEAESVRRAASDL